MSRNGFLVWHAIDVGDVHSEEFLEVVEGRKLFALQTQFYEF